MAEERAEHRPVLLDEVVDVLCRRTDGAYVDATFGRGGHARALLARLDAQARLLVIDRDPAAISVAEALAAADPRVVVRQGRFSEIAEIAETAKFLGVAGVLLDLGVSSPQLDEAGRGFSFRVDGPLDMRMDPRDGPSAAEWLATADVGELERVFREYGEERFARRIARAIVERRAEHPITRTLDLAAIVESSQPHADPHKHAATRVFQAIRIHVNQELDELSAALTGALKILASGGRLAVISFHSLEDRLVKQTFQRWSKGPELPRRLPIRGVAHPQVQILGKALRAGTAEVAANPRARSALLRVVEKVT